MSRTSSSRELGNTASPMRPRQDARVEAVGPGLLVKTKPLTPSSPSRKTVNKSSSRASTPKTPTSSRGPRGSKERGPKERPKSRGMRRYHPHVELLLDPDRDSHTVLPYFVQRDYEMQSPMNKRKRKALRKNHLVELAVDKFMCLFQMTSVGKSPTDPYGVTEDEFVRIHSVVCRMLIPALSPEQAISVAKEDWRLDTKGLKDILTPDDMRDTIFEMTDLWCLDVSVEEYCSFLQALYERTREIISHPDYQPGDTGVDAQTTAFLPQAVHALPVLDSPPRREYTEEEIEIEEGPILKASAPK